MSLPEKVFQKTVTIRLLNKSGDVFDSFEMRSGTNLWVFIRKRGHAIGAACSGVGVCAACAVQIKESTQPDAVSPITDFEKESLARHGKTEPDYRIACLVRVFGDLTVQADYW